MSSIKGTIKYINIQPTDPDGGNERETAHLFFIAVLLNARSSSARVIMIVWNQCVRLARVMGRTVLARAEVGQRMSTRTHHARSAYKSA